MEKKVYELKIDPELSKVAPPLADNELEILRSDILERGCMAPIIVWNGAIVDGHNRYAICSENNIPFGIEEMEFSNMTEAKLWIIKAQIGRRNLQPFQRCEMILPMEDELKAEARKRMSASEREAGMPILARPSRDVLADLAGVSHGTWDKARVIIKECDEPLKQKLRAGNLKIHTAYSMLQKQDDPAKEVHPGKHEVPRGESPIIEAQTERPEKPVHKTGAELPEPLVHMDGPIEVPPMRDKPERKPQPFPYVQDQVRFSIENMIRNLEIAMNWLRDEDQDKIDVLLEMLDQGFDRAEALLKGQEDV